MARVRPLRDRLLVKRIEEQETVRGGIIVPDSAKEKPQEGEVVAVGKGKVTEKGTVLPMDVQVGDRILFGKYTGNEITVDGKEYLILCEDEVLGVLSEKAQSIKQLTKASPEPGPPKPPPSRLEPPKPVAAAPSAKPGAAKLPLPKAIARKPIPVKPAPKPASKRTVVKSAKSKPAARKATAKPALKSRAHAAAAPSAAARKPAATKASARPKPHRKK